jgi:acyl transferase domain-containing protein
MQSMAAACDRFLEIGPQPMLLPLARGSLREDSRFQADGCWLYSLREGADDWTQMLNTLSELYVAGLDVNWESFHRDVRGRRVVLPTYPFERKRYWIDRPPARSSAGRLETPQDDAHESLLPTVTQSPGIEETIFETEQGVENYPYLDDPR